MAALTVSTRHIQANKRRSIALLIGLFLLVFVLVYAGALAAEALTYGCAAGLAHAAGVAGCALGGAVCDARERSSGS